MASRKWPQRPFRVSWSGLVSLGVLVFLFMPIPIILLFSFSDSMALRFPITGFSLRWYRELFGNRQFLTAVRNTAIVGLSTSGVSMGLGTAAALVLTRYRFKLKPVVTAIILIPIALPPLFIGLSLLSLFTVLSLRLSLLTVVIGHIIYALPYFVVVAMARLQRFELVVEEAARDLGASRWTAFWKVTLPIIAPSVIGGGILVFALSFDEFLITFFVIGTQSTLPMMIWSIMRHSITPEVNAVSGIVLALSLAIVLLIDRSMNISEIRA